MGKGQFLLGILLVVLMSSMVCAGNSYDLSFGSGSTQAIYLQEGDEVRFELLNGEHSLIMEQVGSTSVKVDIAPFFNTGEYSMSGGLILLDTIMKIDLDQDGVADVNVALYSVSEEGIVHLVLQDASAESSDLVTGLVTEDEENSLGNYVLGIVGVVIVLLLAFLFFRDRKEVKEDKEEKKEEEKKEEEKKEEEKKEEPKEEKTEDSEPKEGSESKEEEKKED